MPALRMPKEPAKSGILQLPFEERGRFIEALDSYEKSLTMNPNNRMALMNQGLALLELDRLDEALTSFNRALQLEPENMATLRARGITLYEIWA